MKKIGLIVSSLFLLVNLQAEDKLDVLDRQSKEFFKAITGLEKDYLEEQISSINDKKDGNVQNNRQNNLPIINNRNINLGPVIEEKKISEEDYEKNVFKHENEMARLTTDFTRTKKLKDIKIKSMYSFNGKDYVVLKLDKSTSSSKKDDKELSLNIEGRYTKGDYILTHRVIDINTRTKTVRLYKKLDEEYGYTIYLSNYGISVSDLAKREKIVKIEKKPIVEKEIKEEAKKVKKLQKVRNVEVKEESIPQKNLSNITKDKNSVKSAFEKILSKKAQKTESKVKEEKIEVVKQSNCLYTVNVNNLNVRNNTNIDARILRILRLNDEFTVLEKNEDWLKINTIYKKKSGDVMVVEDQNNWVNITDDNILVNDKNCI